MDWAGEMGANLFADVDDDHNDIDTKIEIDEEFARRYEHNKRRETTRSKYNEVY